MDTLAHFREKSIAEHGDDSKVITLEMGNKPRTGRDILNKVGVENAFII
jgi:hypothetical protein